MGISVSNMVEKESLCLKVNLKNAEAGIKYTKEHQYIDTSLKTVKEKNFIFIPIKHKIDSASLSFPATIEKKKVTVQDRIQQYSDLVPLPDELKKYLPASFDIIGDIILVKIPKELFNFKKEIGAALLETHKHIKVVARIEPIQGELRTRDVEIIAGEQRTNTIHKEFGLYFEIDIQNTYYSPRLSNERHRIAQLITEHETIVDMFTGVAPFSVMIAKLTKSTHIYALDKNFDAIRLASRNIQKNHVEENITLIHGDAKNIKSLLPTDHPEINRVIMNLPFSSYTFFSKALNILSSSGIIHYYEILEEEQVQSRLQELSTLAQKQQYSLEILNQQSIKSYSPREFYMCIDIRVKKNADVA